MNSESEIVCLIELFAKEHKRTPTIQAFAQEHSLHASAIIRKFGSWNNLLKKAGLQPNKSNKRSEEQILAWLRAHPDARYYEIPFGIRNRLEDKYETISHARKVAGLRVVDWRSSTKRRHYKKPVNAGRPIEFTEEIIISTLIDLAVRLGRPPRAKDITKKNCGFTPSAILSRFGSLNAALQAASLPVIYTHQEQSKLIKEVETLMVNIKLALKDLPVHFNTEINGLKPTFLYSDRCESVRLKRSEVFSDLNSLLQYKQAFGQVLVWFLVDDSLNENKQISTVCIMDLISQVEPINPLLANHILKLRQQYDEISRKYVGHMFPNAIQPQKE